MEITVGETDRSIDDKGRIVIPTDVREALGEVCILTRGYDHCLNLYSKTSYEALQKRLKDPTGMNRKATILLRRFAPTPVSIDNQGRLPISAALREYAGITSETKSEQKGVVIYGADDHLEIWSKSGWDTYNSSVTDDDVYEAFESVMSRNGSSVKSDE